jgi:aryl-alcohol dehydrogenase-like predicted oxidoreductase
MNASRRNFLAGLALPAVASASRSTGSAPQTPPARPPSSGPVFQYRTLGKTGLKVTTVGFGCMITSDGSVVTRGADLGITYFDTARVYGGGNNERMVGAALKGKRNGITLSSKTHSATGKEALSDLDTSLKELGTDHLDIWYLHAKAAPGDVTDDLIEAQQTAKKAGKIRFAGVSTHQGHATLIPFLAKNPNIDVILAAYNFAMDPAISAVLDEAAKAGKGIVAMKVMGGGMSGGTAGGRGGIIQPPPAKPGNRLAALKWVTRNANVATTVPSMTDMDQLDENIMAMAQTFTPADQKLLAERREQIRPYYCNMCGKCEGTCREGLPVADILRFGMYADSYGQFALGREHFQTLSAEHASVRCATCPGCTVECPEGVRVASRMAHIQGMLA